MKTTAKLPLPIGVSDFKELVSGYYYVDKTLMLKEFIDSKPKVSLLPVQDASEKHWQWIC